ncbi:MAG: hypothetical protein O3B41_12015 [Bacteroidetes bacterium]|nr:hypothetical protein [Bacteroidota bacterium]
MYGGKRPGAGRKKGVQNKVNAALRQKVMADGILPLEFILSIMRDSKNPDEMRLEAAVKAAPFCHPRLQAIEHSGPEGDGIPQSIRVEFV